MDLKLYNDSVLAPVKCGTRFLSHAGLEETGHFQMMELLQIPNIPNLKYIIVREPIEHFESAVMQDCLPILNNKMTKEEQSDKINNVLKQYMDIQGASSLHYYTKLYECIYWFIQKNENKDIQIVNIKHLSKLVQILGLSYEYDKTKYRPFMMEKSSFATWLKSNYEVPFNRCVDTVMGDIRFYDALMSRKVLPIEETTLKFV